MQTFRQVRREYNISSGVSLDKMRKILRRINLNWRITEKKMTIKPQNRRLKWSKKNLTRNAG